MSICAITIGNQNCKAHIRLLRQNIAIDVSSKDICCSLDLIVEVEEGRLEYLYLYIPYSITYSEDRSHALLDENNKYHYKKGFKVISEERREIKLMQLLTVVAQVSLSQRPTKRGTKVTIYFSRPVLSGQPPRAVRILSEWQTSLSYFPGNTYNISPRYYTNNDAVFLNLDKALHVEELDVYLILPHNVSTIRARPEYTLKTWDEPFYLSISECLFGSRTKSIFSKLPIKCCEWIKSTDNNEPALSPTPWTTFHIDCDFEIPKPEEQEKPILAEDKTRTRVKSPYAKMWTHETGLEGKPITQQEYDDLKKDRKKYDLFIDDLDGKVYWDKEEKDMQDETRNLLIKLFQRHRRIYTWEEMEREAKVRNSTLDATIQQKRKIGERIGPLKPFVKTVSGKGYKLTGDISFCVISVD